MKKFLSAVAVCLSLGAAPPALPADVAPDALVRSTVDEVLSVIKQNKDKRALREMAEQRVLPHFDFRQMTQLAVGRSWRDASPAQRQALEAAFRSLLVHTYVSALSQAANGGQTHEVKPLQMQSQQDDVTVKTLLKEPGKQPVAVDYKLAAAPGGWKVYDVVVENFSLVTNYRGTFASEIGRSGIDGLIKALEAKNRSVTKGLTTG